MGGLAATRLREVNRIIIVGCGTSYHAGLAGRNAIERWARIPVEVEVASEFRYREPIVESGTLVLGISQSGETADTLAAMRLARERRRHGDGGDQRARKSGDARLGRRPFHAGGTRDRRRGDQDLRRSGGAALRAGHPSRRGQAVRNQKRYWPTCSAALDELPDLIDHVVASVDQPIRELAERLADSSFFLYLGRLSGLPVALEGALKLKEISYVPTDAYAAGEMKHGPIALLGTDTPVVCVATDRRVLPKLMSNLSEVRARGAQVLAIATEGCIEIAEQAEHVVYIPDTDPLLQVVLGIVPLQLFAYYLARARGLNVDQPRNLAKTVTVE